MVNGLEERSSTLPTKNFPYQLHSIGGNIYFLSGFPLKCTTVSETLVTVYHFFMPLPCTVSLTYSSIDVSDGVDKGSRSQSFSYKHCAT